MKEINLEEANNSKYGKKVMGITYYTAKEVSAMLDLSAESVKAYIRRKKIRAQKVGNRYVITENNLRRFLEGLPAYEFQPMPREGKKSDKTTTK